MLCSMSVGNEKISKYELCQNVTTEIYKRIDLTFAIKEVEPKEPDSASDVIDSNELSNATDLFAYDKSDSLSSSITFEEDGKIISLNNNEEIKKPVRRVARLKKRYRKRVKKKRKLDIDCSSDEEPLSRMVSETRLRIRLKNYRTDAIETEKNRSKSQDRGKEKAQSSESDTSKSDATNREESPSSDEDRDSPGPSKSTNSHNLVSRVDPSAIESRHLLSMEKSKVVRKRVKRSEEKRRCKLNFNPKALRRYLKSDAAEKIEANLK